MLETLSHKLIYWWVLAYAVIEAYYMCQGLRCKLYGINGSGCFDVNGILLLQAILSSDLCDWSILMTYYKHLTFGCF